MIPLNYTYLLLGLLFLVIWFILFFIRKDTRRELLIISFVFGVGGILVEPIYLKDWWQPLTITGTPVGIEDFLFGFTIGGIASIIYEVIFYKRTKKAKTLQTLTRKHKFDTFIVLLLPIIFFGTNIIFNLNTLNASILGFAVPLIIIYFRRKDLIKDSLLSGVILLLLAFIIYSVVEIFSPGWVTHFWTFENVPPIIFWNVPIDDLIWYILAGAFIGVIYEFVQDSPVFRLKKVN
jgi:hypothetical protein